MSARVRPFILRVAVSGEFWRHDPKMAAGLAHDALLNQSLDLKGPRGGRYERVNQPHDFRDGEDGDAFARNEHVFAARVTGRYVRPAR